MIALIVNADDLGSNRERDRGIFLAHEEGIVTSVSLLANGSSFHSATEYVKAHRIPTGVHLNLADGRTLSGEIKGLTGSHGELPGKDKLRECLRSGDCDQDAIRRELGSQIVRVLDCGITPDHIDTHQHCQIFPCMSKMVCELAREFGIRCMRTALPAEPEESDPQGPLGEEMALYRQLADEAHKSIHAAGLISPDGLWGMTLLNRLDEPALCQLLNTLPEGTWELMTHPGYASETGNSFDSVLREVELRALTSRTVFDIIKQRGIKLCTFGNLACAS